jgi:hypothetical protein
MLEHEYRQQIIDLFRSGRASETAWQELGAAIFAHIETDMEEIVETIIQEVGEWELTEEDMEQLKVQAAAIRQKFQEDK